MPQGKDKRMRWDHTEYGETWAEIYDDVFAWVDDTEPSVSKIAQIARGNGVLELGAGTGRVAVPLARNGIQVHAVELSEKMVKILEVKASAAQALLTVHQADMCDIDLGEKFGVVFLSHNTLSALPTQDDQLTCIRTAARHVHADGSLIIDQGIPGIDMLKGDGSLRFTRTDNNGTWVIGHRHDWATQQVISQRMRFAKDEFFSGTIKGRYVWPGELDLMASLAGLRLSERWSDWSGNEFRSSSQTFISRFQPCDTPD
jgi:SAM-dependent methyltransferase